VVLIAGMSMVSRGNLRSFRRTDTTVRAKQRSESVTSPMAVASTMQATQQDASRFSGMPTK